MKVDIENPDLEAFPLFAEATFHELLVRPGDTVFIPA